MELETLNRDLQVLGLGIVDRDNVAATGIRVTESESVHINCTPQAINGTGTQRAPGCRGGLGRSVRAGPLPGGPAGGPLVRSFRLAASPARPRRRQWLPRQVTFYSTEGGARPQAERNFRRDCR